MSLPWKMTEIILDAPLRATEKSVLNALSMRTREGRCFPSVGKVMRDTGLSDGAVRAAIRRLEGDGWLTVTRVPGRKSTYQISIPPELLCPADIAGAIEPLHDMQDYPSAFGAEPLHVVQGGLHVVQGGLHHMQDKKRSPQQAAGYWWKQIRIGLTASLHEVFCTSLPGSARTFLSSPRLHASPPYIAKYPSDQNSPPHNRFLTCGRRWNTSPSRDTFDHLDNFLHGIHRHRLNQKVDVILIRADLKKLDLVPGLYIKANIP